MFTHIYGWGDFQKYTKVLSFSSCDVYIWKSPHASYIDRSCTLDDRLTVRCLGCAGVGAAQVSGGAPSVHSGHGWAPLEGHPVALVRPLPARRRPAHTAVHTGAVCDGHVSVHTDIVCCAHQQCCAPTVTKPSCATASTSTCHEHGESALLVLLTDDRLSLGFAPTVSACDSRLYPPPIWCTLGLLHDIYQHEGTNWDDMLVPPPYHLEQAIHFSFSTRSLLDHSAFIPYVAMLSLNDVNR